MTLTTPSPLLTYYDIFVELHLFIQPTKFRAFMLIE